MTRKHWTTDDGGISLRLHNLKVGDYVYLHVLQSRRRDGRKRNRKRHVVISCPTAIEVRIDETGESGFNTT